MWGAKQGAGSADQIQEAIAHARAAGRSLRGLRRGAIAAALAATARTLSMPSELTVSHLSRSSRLSEGMVRWALQNSFAPMSQPLLDATLCDPSTRLSPGPRTTALFLARNVFLSSFEPVTMLLLQGSAVVARASSRDNAFVDWFRTLLVAADPDVGAALRVVRFSRDAIQATELLCASVDAVVGYGGAEAIGAVAAQIPASVRWYPQGPGLGAVVLLSSDVDDESVVDRVALDVVAYDQRGCLSPHFIVTEGIDVARAETFAKALLCAMERWDHSLPRGSLDADDAAAVMRWRGVARACGSLLEGVSAAVSLEAVPRASPGFRNIAVIPTRDREETVARLGAFRGYLTVVGTTSPARWNDLATWAAAPRSCAVGALQAPQLGAHWRWGITAR